MLRSLVNRAAVVGLIVFCTVVFGMKTYVSMPREASPDIDIPVVLVTTPYIGVSPEDIETLVTNPIENELAGLKDVKKMSSTSAEGISIVTLEFEPEVVIEDALQRVRDRVNRARTKLPQEVEETGIREVSFSDFPIMILTIAGPQDEEILKKLGEDIAEDIRRINGVLDAKVTGGREREIRVQVDPYRLQHYGLALGDVIGAISAENVNIPGGNVTTGEARFLLRVPGEFEAAKEIEQVAIKRVGDRPVFVRDVGRVIDDYDERESYARMNGRDAVSVAVSKRTGANILEVAEAVKAMAAEQSKTWPKGVSYRVLGDQSKMIRDMVAELENGIITALILVVGVILFAMGVRNSLFIAAAIPLSMLVAILGLAGFGFTLNMIVLFSLILALGMLVDNAIVLVENIYRHVEMGKSLKDAAVDGTAEVAGAVAASTATTVAAFLPLVFWTGIMGQFMGYMPKTVVIVLISSLLVALIVLPVLTGRFMKRAPPKAKKEKSGPAAMIMLAYQRILEASINHRYITAFIGFASLVGTFVAYGALNHGTEFFPETEPNRATITIRAPDGTDLEATDELVRRIEGFLVQEENVDIYVAETGVSGGGDPMDGAQAAPNAARITVDFLPDRNTAKSGEKVRVEATTDTIDRIRKKVAVLAGAEIIVEKERMGPPVGAPIAVEVTGEDFHGVGELASKVRRDLSKLQGVTDLRDDYRVGRPELRLRINRGAAKRVGADTRTIASTLRTAVAGTVASVIRDGEDEYDIVVEFAPEYRDRLTSVLSLRIPGRQDRSPKTFPVPLSAVATHELTGGSGAIKHIDQKLVVTITGEIQEGENENAVRERVRKYTEEASFKGYHLRLGGADDEQRNAQEFLGNAFLIALFLIAIVLVTEFNRFDLPLIILASVILSLVGVLWGLVLTKTPFGVMMTGLGVISLAGVVVNNAIVLLDYVQQLRDRGVDVRSALIEAGLTRFRPVMLTAITTMLGLIPMAVGISFDFREFKWILGSSTAQWWGPMAVAVIFGLAVATVLTLVMVPTMYSILEDIRGLFRRKSSSQV